MKGANKEGFVSSCCWSHLQHSIEDVGIGTQEYKGGNYNYEVWTKKVSPHTSSHTKKWFIELFPQGEKLKSHVGCTVLKNPCQSYFDTASPAHNHSVVKWFAYSDNTIDRPWKSGGSNLLSQKRSKTTSVPYSHKRRWIYSWRLDYSVALEQQLRWSRSPTGWGLPFGTPEKKCTWPSGFCEWFAPRWGKTSVVYRSSTSNTAFMSTRHHHINRECKFSLFPSFLSFQIHERNGCKIRPLGCSGCSVK